MTGHSPPRPKIVGRVILAILWPPSAPLSHAPPQLNRDWWAALCIACIIPIAAVLHHRIFWLSQCMLNPFGDDYTPSVIHAWLLGDPSLPWAIILAGVCWVLGTIYAPLKMMVAPVFSSTLPLSVWLWDIPFSGRFICRHFHDGGLALATGVPLSTRHFYGLAGLLYLAFVGAILVKERRIGAGRIVAGAT